MAILMAPSRETEVDRQLRVAEIRNKGPQRLEIGSLVTYRQAIRPLACLGALLMAMCGALAPPTIRAMRTMRTPSF